ncbi:FtsX-like permease family protein [uncultured Clostridium sp.]|uniref:FtsX-like permease family protein n=1 Tax=uncultured Clostridium sp. TaxID=59620 RepID=UPI0028EB9B99|nr:FtsX-like permease family protein [uncultured Clostridium sp.]
MFQNNNSKVTKKLANRTLKANKSRNFFAILAIVLTTLLFTSVFTVGMNLMKSMEIATMKQVGSSCHGAFKGLTEEQYEKIKGHTLIKDYGITMYLATASNKEFKSKGIEIRYADEKWAKYGFSLPTTGNLPENKNEIAMPTWALDMIKVPHKIGTPVHIDYEINEVQYSKDFILSGFWEGDKYVSISGYAFVSRDFIEEVMRSVDFKDVSTNPDYEGMIDLDVMFDNSWDIEGKLKRITEEVGVDLKGNRYGVSWAYISSKGIDFENILPFLIVILLILVSGYLLTYNIFYISVVKDIKYFGLLKTIGTSPKQLKDIIKKQAITLSFIGIPIGLLLGYFIGVVITPLVTEGSMAESSTTFSVNPIIFIGAIIFTFITVFLSSNKPGKIAAKVSPIDAVRYTGISLSSNRKEKSSTNGAKIYKMAFLNIFRNKRKTIIVIMSLSLSIIILNFVATLISGFSMDLYLEEYIRGDFVIGNSTYHTHYIHFDGEANLTKEICDDIEKNKDVNRLDKVYYSNEETEINENIRKVIINRKENMDEDIAKWIKGMLKEGKTQAQVYGLDEGWFDIYRKDHIIEGEFDREKFKTGKYVLVDQGEYYNPGEQIKISTHEGEERSFEVMAVVKDLYVYDVKYSSISGTKVYMPSSSFVDFIKKPVIMCAQVYAKEGKVDQVESYIKSLFASNTELEYRARTSYIDEYKSFVNNFSTVGFSLSLLIGVIGIINFINTLLISIISRKHEFALLESIGMTKKQLKKMLVYEGIYYGGITTFIVFTLGTFIVQFGVKSFGNPMPHFVYNFNIMPTVISSFILMIISFILPIICYSSIEKLSVIERLREME